MREQLISYASACVEEADTLTFIQHNYESAVRVLEMAVLAIEMINDIPPKTVTPPE